jgi:hypothetical protein
MPTVVHTSAPFCMPTFFAWNHADGKTFSDVVVSGACRLSTAATSTYCRTFTLVAATF